MHATTTSQFIYQYLPIDRELWVHLQKHGKTNISIDENKYILKSTELNNFSFAFFFPVDEAAQKFTARFSALSLSVSVSFLIFLHIQTKMNAITPFFLLCSVVLCVRLKSLSACMALLLCNCTINANASISISTGTNTIYISFCF